METMGRIQRLALAGALGFGSLFGAGAIAAAQQDPEWEPDYYQSQLTGYEIEVAGSDFVIDDVIYQEYDDGENEQIYIEGEVSTAQVSFFDDSDAPEDTIELWISDLSEGLDSLEVVGSGVDGDVTWYYAEGSFEDLDVVYYVQVQEDIDGNVDMLESVLTLDGELLFAIEAAQEDITIDGDGFMDDVDLDDLEEFLDGGTFRDSGDDGTDGSSGTDDQGTSRDDDQDRDREDDSSTTRDRERVPAGDDDSSSTDDSDDSTDTNTDDDPDAEDDSSGT